MSALDAARRQRRSLDQTAHRPWEVPERPWFMGQTWKRLLFAHWPVEPDSLKRVMPSELPLDVVDGRAWIAVTPFAVEGLRVRGVPPAPILSSFPEINVRTYVTVDGRPGIYFFSLDTSSRFAVTSARRIYRVPYFHAQQSFDGTTFTSSRTDPSADFRASYRPAGAAEPAKPGTIEHFLTERYCLYTLDAERRVLRGEIHHPPWPLQAATAEIEVNSMGRQIGIELEGTPMLHFSERQDVVFWQLAAAA